MEASSNINSRSLCPQQEFTCVAHGSSAVLGPRSRRRVCHGSRWTARPHPGRAPYPRSFFPFPDQADLLLRERAEPTGRSTGTQAAYISPRKASRATPSSQDASVDSLVKYGPSFTLPQ